MRFRGFSYQAGLSDRDLPELAWKRQFVPNIAGDLALSLLFTLPYILFQTCHIETRGEGRPCKHDLQR